MDALDDLAGVLAFPVTLRQSRDDLGDQRAEQDWTHCPSCGARFHLTRSAAHADTPRSRRADGAGVLVLPGAPAASIRSAAHASEAGASVVADEAPALAETLERGAVKVRVEHIGDATLYLGDCLEVLPTVGKVDAVVTDPPYGVDFNGKVTKHADRRGECQSYADDEASWTATVPPAIEAALSIASRAAIFPGTRRLQQYPKARDIGGIITPNGAGMSSWGFGCYHPVLYYGSSPFVGARPTAIVMYPAGLRVTGEDDIDHPCPKPLAFMEWAVARASLECETVLDPFMGSGTTGVACAKLGRKFIGIEIHEPYFDIACRRIEEAYRQPRLFAEPALKPQQAALPLNGAE